ncbi:MAG: RtcB family protein [Rhodanobacteraceae bacterium]|nr:RtcB family protein [Rhodanobacteraceae bacterium]
MDASAGGARGGARNRRRGLARGGSTAGRRRSGCVRRAKHRQRGGGGALGSSNHYLEGQAVAAIYDKRPPPTASPPNDVVVTALRVARAGPQVGAGICATGRAGASTTASVCRVANSPTRRWTSPLGKAYLGAVRAAVNCALASRQIPPPLARGGVASGCFRKPGSACCTVCRTTPAGGAGWVGAGGAAARKGRPAPSDQPRRCRGALRTPGQPVLIDSSVGRFTTPAGVAAGGNPPHPARPAAVRARDKPARSVASRRGGQLVGSGAPAHPKGGPSRAACSGGRRQS